MKRKEIEADASREEDTTLAGWVSDLVLLRVGD
jgi:hypothetical protein